MHASKEAIDQLNSMLRGELSATETYQQALDRVGNKPEAVELRRIHAEHREAANTLRQHVRSFGGEPEHGSGGWGAFAKAVEGTAKIFGSTAAMKALKEGEEHGAKQYQDAQQSDDLPEECRLLVSGTLLPRTQEHIQTLDRLMTA